MNFINKNLTKFLEAVSINKVKIVAPEPKFKVGDYIMNTKFKVISKVLDINGVFENEDRTVNYEAAQYVLEDVKNEGRDKFMSERGYLTSQPVKRSYKRYKYTHKIDPTYDKVSPDVVQALYGSKVTNEG